jgi:hypothetical protein
VSWIEIREGAEEIEVCGISIAKSEETDEGYDGKTEGNPHHPGIILNPGTDSGHRPEDSRDNCGSKKLSE